MNISWVYNIFQLIVRLSDLCCHVAIFPTTKKKRKFNFFPQFLYFFGDILLSQYCVEWDKDARVHFSVCFRIVDKRSVTTRRYIIQLLLAIKANQQRVPMRPTKKKSFINQKQKIMNCAGIFWR